MSDTSTDASHFFKKKFGWILGHSNKMVNIKTFVSVILYMNKYIYLYISFVCVCLCVLEYVCVYSTKKIHQSCLYPLPLSPTTHEDISYTVQVSCAPIAIAQCRLLFYWPHTRTPGVVGEEREGEGGGRWARGWYFKVDSIQSCRGYLGTMSSYVHD